MVVVGGWDEGVGSGAPLKGPRNCGVFDAQIYAFSHILETLSLSFLTSSPMPKAHKKEHYVVI